jgi:uncharacterized protein YkwD
VTGRRLGRGARGPGGRGAVRPLKATPGGADILLVSTVTTATGHQGTRTYPIRRGLAFLVSATVMLVPLQAQRAEAVTEDEAAFSSMVNDVRDRHGVRRLKLTERLSSLARRHSRQMAARNELYHSNLRRTFRGFNYRMVGENVGYGGSLDQLMNAFLDSPPHRQNLVGRWRRTGVGVYWDGDRVWITQLFYT